MTHRDNAFHFFKMSSNSLLFFFQKSMVGQTTIDCTKLGYNRAGVSLQPKIYGSVLFYVKSETPFSKPLS